MLNFDWIVPQMFSRGRNSRIYPKDHSIISVWKTVNCQGLLKTAKTKICFDYELFNDPRTTTTQHNPKCMCHFKYKSKHQESSFRTATTLFTHDPPDPCKAYLVFLCYGIAKRALECQQHSRA